MWMGDVEREDPCLCRSKSIVISLEWTTSMSAQKPRKEPKQKENKTHTQDDFSEKILFIIIVYTEKKKKMYRDYTFFVILCCTIATAAAHLFSLHLPIYSIQNTHTFATHRTHVSYIVLALFRFGEEKKMKKKLYKYLLSHIRSEWKECVELAAYETIAKREKKSFVQKS